jgi:hypothetical protein
MSPSAVDPVVAARRSLRAVLWTGAACILLPWVLGYPAQLWMAGRAQSAAGSTPETIVLRAGQAAGAPKGRFVRLEAVPQGDLVYGVTRERSGTSGSTQYYVPLTSPEWTPQEPVRYFLHFSRHGEPTRDDFDGPYVGEVGADSLPTPVAKEYERAGVTLARPYFVVERIDLVDGKVPDTSENAFAGYVIISAAFTLFGLLLVLGGWIGYRKKMAALA